MGDDDAKPAVETLLDRLQKQGEAFGGENKTARTNAFNKAIKQFMHKDYGAKYVDYIFQEKSLDEVRSELELLGDALHFTEEELKDQMNKHYKEFIDMVYQVQTLDSGMGRLRSSLADLREICMKLKDQSESDLNAAQVTAEEAALKETQGQSEADPLSPKASGPKRGGGKGDALHELYQEFEKEFDLIDVQLSQRDFKTAAMLVKTVDRKIKDKKCGNTESGMLRGHLNNRKSALCKALSRELSNPTLKKNQAKFIIGLMIEINQMEDAKDIYLLGRHEWLQLKTRALEKEGDIQAMISRLAETVFGGIRATKNEYTKHFQHKELLSSFTVWACAEVDNFWYEARKVVLSAPTFRSMAESANQIVEKCDKYLQKERIGLKFHLENLMLKDLRIKVGEGGVGWSKDLVKSIKADLDDATPWCLEDRKVELYNGAEQDEDGAAEVMVETEVMVSSSAFKVYERIKEEMYNMELLCTNKDLYPVIAQSLSSLISGRNDDSVGTEGGYFEILVEHFAEALDELGDDDDEEQEANRIVWAMLSNAAFLAHQLLPSLEQRLAQCFDGLVSVELVRTRRSCNTKFNKMAEEFSNAVLKAALPEHESNPDQTGWPDKDLMLHDSVYNEDELEVSSDFEELWETLDEFRKMALGTLGATHGVEVCNQLFIVLANKVKDTLKTMVSEMDKDLKLGKGGVYQALVDVFFLIEAVKEFELPSVNDISMTLEQTVAYMRMKAEQADGTMLMGADDEWFEARAKEGLTKMHEEASMCG